MKKMLKKLVEKTKSYVKSKQVSMTYLLKTWSNKGCINPCLFRTIMAYQICAIEHPKRRVEYSSIANSLMDEYISIGGNRFWIDGYKFEWGE